MHRDDTTVTTGDIARLLGCSRRHAGELIDRGILPGWRLPGSTFRRALRADVLKLAREHNIPIDGEPQPEEANL